jgi:outer membrane immunogenic protein
MKEALPMLGEGRMKFIFLASTALIALATGRAVAADFPDRPAPILTAPTNPDNWTGFYVGANGGAAWSRTCWTFVPAIGAPLAEGCHDPIGGALGGHVGFNWQTGPMVWGIEAQGDWVWLAGSNVSQAFPAFTNRTQIDAIVDVTGRVGYIWAATLLYVKGGGAWMRDRYSATVTATGLVAGSASETRSGWIAGAGVEWNLTRNWSAALEYNRFDFGKNTVGFTTPTGAVFANDRITQEIDLVTARFSYRFGAPWSTASRY